MESRQSDGDLENLTGEDIHDAVVMGKVCHMIVDNVGDDNVF